LRAAEQAPPRVADIPHTVRLPQIRSLCVVVLALSAFPAPALAGNGGGTTAPTGPRTDAGGSSYEEGYALSERERRLAARERRRKAAARKRQQDAAARERRRVAARRRARAVERERSRALDGQHRIPLAGAFDLGGADAGFGARRRGHRHQGQDLAAALGTPVVAPWAGVVEYVRYQRSGAGHYVVLDGGGEDLDYVFMHLRGGSIPVRPGQHVAAGDLLGEVGNTGRSFGAHLHFEVWVGGWYENGGQPIDPLPLLRAWSART
jgi:murein DD-endopeptidase MepM/ murein hydrolase activator NlpD